MLHNNLNKRCQKPSVSEHFQKLRSRKGQGLSLNIIIIAVIALLVLVVIVFIFTGRARTFTKGVESCESKGGVCPVGKDSCEGLGPMIGKVPAISCDSGGEKGKPNEGRDIDGDICCLKLT